MLKLNGDVVLSVVVENQVVLEVSYKMPLDVDGFVIEELDLKLTHTEGKPLDNELCKFTEVLKTFIYGSLEDSSAFQDKVHESYNKLQQEPTTGEMDRVDRMHEKMFKAQDAELIRAKRVMDAANDFIMGVKK
jgi:hypothetical protein